MAHLIYLIVESVILAAAAFLNWYSDKRMGLNRHFLFEQYRFEQWAEASNFTLILVVLVSFLVLLTIIIIVMRRSDFSKWGWAHLFFTAVLLIGLVVMGSTSLGLDIIISPYLFIAFPVLILGNTLGLYFDLIK